MIAYILHGTLIDTTRASATTKRKIVNVHIANTTNIALLGFAGINQIRIVDFPIRKS
ncbi:MAG: hypothetical protein GY780_03965 [bacterium]|nr:hypothetical protein [bacterium]